MMTIIMMIMMIITGAFSNNTEKTILNIFRPFPRKNPMWFMNITYISEKT